MADIVRLTDDAIMPKVRLLNNSGLFGLKLDEELGFTLTRDSVNLVKGYLQR